MNTIFHNLRHGWRLLNRNRATTVVVLLTLALGIGANVSLYSIARAVLLKPLPFSGGDRLMLVWESQAKTKSSQLPFSMPDYLDLRRQAHSFSALEAFRFAPTALTGRGEPTSLQGLRVTPGLLPSLGVEVQRGRLFSGALKTPEAGAVLSDRSWRQHFGADPGALGSALELDGQTYTVVGVLPPGFQFPPPITVNGQSMGLDEGAEIFLPLDVTRSDARRRNLLVLGTLAPGVSPQAANAELKVLASQMVQLRPEVNPPDLTAYAVSLEDQAVEEVRTLVVVLFFAAGLLLLVVCANVANVLLARATGRSREFSVRLALGASRFRLFRQLLTESLVLGLGGAVLGALLAFGLARVLGATPIEGLPLENIRIDLPVLGFSLLLALVTNLLFGFAPALHASRSVSSRSLAEMTSASATPTLGRLPLQRILVVCELALSIILLSAVGLMLRSLWSLQRADLGVDPKDVLTVILDFPEEKYPEPARKTQAVEAMVDQLRAQPEIAEAGAVSALPFSAMMDGIRFLIEQESTGSEQIQIATRQVITPGYLETMGLHVVQGRGFNSGDRRDSPPVVLISQSLALRHWPNRSPVGQRMAVGKEDIDAKRWSTVLGVVQDLRLQGRTTAARPVVYLPVAQLPSPTMTLVGRVRDKATTGPAALRRAVWAVDPALPIELHTMRERLDEAALQPRVGAWVLGLFASVALTLGALGIYGIVSCNVAARRREIAIRMALGAQRREITTLFLRSTLIMFLVGLVLGLGGALAIGQALASMLFGLSSTQPSMLVLIAAFLCLIGLASTYLPVKIALRKEDIAAELRAS
ncbi:MAG TPA: ABC transporter permease [Thermoanaerobaculia bacterium]|nr:ABC transporter permease [Thermoanaerobaculia bacterium]